MSIIEKQSTAQIATLLSSHIEEVTLTTSKPSALTVVWVPLMLFLSSFIMSMAWLGHLRFKSLPIGFAIFFAWMLVLPEYFLNISALRMGYGTFTAGLMAAFRVSTGVICVACVSHYFLGETLTSKKLIGFALMIVSLMLISVKKKSGSKKVDIV